MGMLVLSKSIGMAWLTRIRPVMSRLPDMTITGMENEVFYLPHSRTPKKITRNDSSHLSRSSPGFQRLAAAALVVMVSWICFLSSRAVSGQSGQMHSLRLSKAFDKRKTRCIPLRNEVVLVLRQWLKERNGQPAEAIFIKLCHQPMSRDGGVVCEARLAACTPGNARNFSSKAW